MIALLAAALVAAALVAAVRLPAARSAPDTHDCGLPHDQPLWIEYGTGSVPPDVRAVFSRPGVVVAATGTTLPRDYRAKGAATTYFVNLPPLVGEPATPNDPATIRTEADQLYEIAVTSTACQTPWIALNELLGSQLPTPWSPTNTKYRANILGLVERLAERGARPALLVHGDPNTAGDAAAWWSAVSRSASIVYEAYYNAGNISRLGPVLGNRRMRLGMRNIIDLYGSSGIPSERLGFMLGFQVALSAGGREGLQPREEWFRVVKWHALAARQVALDHGTPTVWSWGWGNFGPQSIDPDKPAAACVYLWTRNPALCDGPAVAGPTFNTSLEEGQIVLPVGAQCTFSGGVVQSGAVADLARLTRDPHAALTALFARAALRPTVRVSGPAILRAERRVVDMAFHGSRKSYLRALARRGTTVSIARDILADDLRRTRIASLAAQTADKTALTWAADVEAAAVDTAICRRDELPGRGDFPRVNAREVGVVPLPAYLPFLLRDRTPPAPPGAPAATIAGGTIVLDWPDGKARDLIGYHLYRATTPGGPYRRLTDTALVRSAFTDVSPPAGVTASYVVRAVDTSRNQSAPSAEVSAPPAVTAAARRSG